MLPVHAAVCVWVDLSDSQKVKPVSWYGLAQSTKDKYGFIEMQIDTEIDKGTQKRNAFLCSYF